MTTDFQKTIEAAKTKAKATDAQEALAKQNMTEEEQAAYRAMSDTEKAAHMKELLAKSESNLVKSTFGEKTATAPKVTPGTVTTTQ